MTESTKYIMSSERIGRRACRVPWPARHTWRSGARALRLTLCVVLGMSAIGPASALAWTTTKSDSWDTHDWIVNEAVVLCDSWDFSWVSLKKAIPACQEPDATSVPIYTCDPAEPGHTDIDSQIGTLYESAVAAYRAGDFSTASTIAGRLGHLIGDVGDPSFTGSWGATSTPTVRWREFATSYTGASLQNHGWISEQPVTYSRDVTRSVTALRSRTASRARRLKPLAEAAKNGWTLEGRQLLAEQLADTTRVLANLYASIAADAVNPVVPVERVAGRTRYETAAALALASYPAGADCVVVSSGAAWADGLTGSSLAGALDAPLLLCKTTSVPAVVRDAVATLGAHRVVLLGGTSVLSEDVAREFDRMSGVSVRRVAGPSRYSTARAVARTVRNTTGKTPTEVFVATGADFADALSVSQISARRNSPVILSRPGSPAQETVEAVRSTGARRVCIVGGPAAVAPAVENALASTFGRSAVTRTAGADRYETASKVMALNETITGKAVKGVYIASGRVFADAIAGGPAAAADGMGLLLTRPVRLESCATRALATKTRRASIKSVTVLGGTAALGDFIGFDTLRALDPKATYPPAYSAYKPTVAVQYAYCANTSSRTLGHYYNDRTLAYESRQDSPRDGNQIVMVDYEQFDKPVYNPVTIAQYALGAYDVFLNTGDKTAKAEFIRHANWLRDSGMDAEGRFAYTWFYSSRGLTPPWYSAMAQGMGISALLRAYQLTGYTSYLTAAKKAFRPFTISVGGGGVTTRDGVDLWLEEYTEPDPTQVLNGSIFAMWGVWDLYRVTGDATAKNVFDRATATLARHLDDYEYRGYCLYERQAGHYSNRYHAIHVRQLRALTGITGNMAFANRADRWSLIPKNPEEDPKTVALGVSIDSVGGRIMSDGPIAPDSPDAADFDAEDACVDATKEMLLLGF